MVRKLSAEVLGTGLLVYLAVGVATLGHVQLLAPVQHVADRARHRRLGRGQPHHISAGGAFLVEVVLTAVFVFAVLQATSRTANAAVAGVVVGFALTLVHLIGIPITGTSVNPARSLGPALIVGGTALSQVWLFIVAPLVGGVLAAGLHRLLYPEADESLASGDLPTAAVD